MHCVKYAGIRVSSDSYFLVYSQIVLIGGFIEYPYSALFYALMTYIIKSLIRCFSKKWSFNSFRDNPRSEIFLGTLNIKNSLREKCPYLGFFWFVFSHIRTEYVSLRVSPYSVQRREDTDQKNSKYGHFLRSD